MKVIFLDVDGVLNCRYSTARIHGCLGIDPVLVDRLSHIVSETGAKVVLTSTWKLDWKPYSNICELNAFGQYMVNSLLDRNIEIIDKTTEKDMSLRGEGILDWLNSHPDVDSFVILDDELFDYRKCKLLPYVVKSRFYTEDGGLTEEHVEQAIKILNKENI